jgi:hypothetical protein
MWLSYYQALSDLTAFNAGAGQDTEGPAICHRVRLAEQAIAASQCTNAADAIKMVIAIERIVREEVLPDEDDTRLVSLLASLRSYLQRSQ